MADNVGYTAGSGTTIASDDIGSVQFQRVKLTVGADGVNDGDVDKSNPLPTGGLTTTVTATPTVSASPAYASGDCVGGKLSFSNAVRSGPVSGIIQSVRVKCKSAQTFPLDVVFFSADPSATTFTDNGAIALNSADWNKVCGKAQITGTAPAAWVNMGTPSFAEAENLGIPIKLASTTLYAIVISRGTPTLGSTSDIEVSVDILQD